MMVYESTFEQICIQPENVTDDLFSANIKTTYNLNEIIIIDNSNNKNNDATINNALDGVWINDNNINTNDNNDKLQ